VTALRIVQGGLDDPRVVALLQLHLTPGAGGDSAGSAHALDLSGSGAPDMSFWSVWEGTSCWASARSSS
jgi:putative acetyltransferase